MIRRLNDGYQKFPNFGIIKTPHYYHFIDYYQPLARIQAHAITRGNEQKVDIAVADVVKGSMGEMRMTDPSLDFLNAKLPQPMNLTSGTQGIVENKLALQIEGGTGRGRGRPKATAVGGTGVNARPSGRGRKKGLDLTDYLV